ncbi:MAG: amino acid deaminase/aldolase, partial [bacterium]|nr:amino acid deaminase/aldolase [bacterium]
KSALIRWMKRRSIPKIAKRRADIVLALVGRGAVLRFVNGGGTGSLESTAQEACVTEVTVGSGFYSPALFDHYQVFKHLPAAGFALEIVRQPKQGMYTCLGGGYIASGGIDKVKAPLPYLPEGATLTDLEGAGEVQTPIVYHGDEVLGLGDPVFLRHSKAGELCEHFMTLLLVRGGKVVDEVTTYRGDGMCFLG